MIKKYVQYRLLYKNEQKSWIFIILYWFLKEFNFFLHLALPLNTKTENKNKLNVINWVTLNVVFWWKNQRKKKLLKTKHCTIFSNIKTKTHLEDIILKNYPYKKKTEISNKLFLCNNLYNWCLKKKKLYVKSEYEKKKKML